MAETTRSAVEITDWPGLALEVDEFNLQGGQSHEQTNWAIEDSGSVVTRPGYIMLQFDNE